MKRKIFCLIVAALLAGCAANYERESENKPIANKTAANDSRAEENAPVIQDSINKNPINSAQSVNPRQGQTIDSKIKEECLKNRLGEKVPDAKQTFALDFEPFTDACFITFHDPEFTDPPLDSEFYVYRGGKQLFKFPSQFNADNPPNCWVTAVSFIDLNDDNLKDIIVTGMCSAKTAPYGENMVYVNTGKSFSTSDEANLKLENFKNIGEIENFVRRNKQLFFN